MKTKITSAILLAAMLATVSCGGGGSTSEATTTAGSSETTTAAVTLSEMEQYPLPEKDMEDFEFRFYNYNNEYVTWAVNELTATEESGDNVNDEIYRRNMRIEQKYNCTITETAVRNTVDGFRDLMMAGDDLYDIAMIYDESVASLYSEGLLLSWDVLPYVDTERSWWNQNANDVFTIKGKQFAAVGDFTLAMNSRGFVLIFNKDLMEEVQVEKNPYELVNANQWTSENFLNMAKLFTRDLNGDTVLDENDQWGAGGAVKQHYGALVTGAGVKYIEIGDDGNPYFSIPGNERATDVFEAIFNLHSGSDLYYLGTETDVHTVCKHTKEMFKSGQIAFTGTSTKAIANYRDMDYDIGIVPYPKFDENQEEYYVLTSGCGVATIPVTVSSDRFENISIIIDALSRDSQDGLMQTYREVVLKTKYSRDEDSANMLDIIFKSGTFDLGTSVWPQTTYYKFMENYLKMTNNFASMTESQKPLVEKEIAKLIEAIEANA